MNAFVADTSALVAILNAEDDAEQHMMAFYTADIVFMSLGTVLEANCVVRREHMRDGIGRLEMLFEEISPDIIPFDFTQFDAAREAYSRYGRGTRHPAKLNLGDCFSYALAKTRDLPLLFKGNDFIHTDIVPALKPA